MIHPDFAGLSLANALESWFVHLTEEEHARPGIHVSDLVSGPGSKCLFFLYLAAQDHPRVTTYAQRKLTKDLKLGEAFHLVVERAADSALRHWIEVSKLPVRIDDVVIEKECVDDIGVRYTPDIVIYASLPTGETATIVVDIKTVSQKKFEQGLRGRSGYTVEASYRRQLAYYMHALGADFGVFEMVKREAPFTVHEVFQVPDTAAALLMRQRVVNVVQALAEGENPPPNLGRHCVDCALRSACARARGVPEPGDGWRDLDGETDE